MAWAHDPGLSSLEIKYQADGVKVELRLSARDMALAVPESDGDGDGVVRADEVSMGNELLRSAVGRWVTVTSMEGNIVLSPLAPKVSWNAEDEDIMWQARFPREPGGQWRVDSTQFAQLPPGHHLFATAQSETGATLAEALLRADKSALVVRWMPVGSNRAATVGAEVDAPAVDELTPEGTGSWHHRVWLFFKLGVEHILIGYDHLLFLAGLLIACRGWKQMLGVITSFTVAHSITLGLAALDIIHFPGAWVEPLIAASIVYVGIENLVRKDENLTGRWKLTFGFGLIHGFGFAGVLRELGIGDEGGGVTSALLGFNLGVEAGQFAIALLVLPLLAKARNWPRFEAKGPLVISLLVAAMGLFWLIQRTMF